MFKKKEDAYATAKVALKIAARHMLKARPEIMEAIKIICSFSEEPDLSDVAAEVINKNQTLFASDPLLKADVLDLLSLIGLDAISIDTSRTKALMSVLCGMV